MKNRILSLIIFIFSSASIFAQYPTTIQVESVGQLFYSPLTLEGTKYTIRVEGTFSIWPHFTDCRGFDAGYVYEAPQEEIDAWRWPPEYLELFGTKIELFKLPKWVGDSTLYQIPPPQIATPLVELSMERQKGFRINGKAIPNTGYNPAHIYEMEYTGDGKPFVFQIIDSNYTMEGGTNIPRYEDNCGYLTVHIIEHIENDSIMIFENCNDYFLNNMYFLNSKIYFQSKLNTTIENLISPANKTRLYFDNQFFIAEDINCAFTRQNSEVFFLLDNSGSMLAGESKNDTVQRIDVAKNLINSALSMLNQDDRISLVSFGKDIELEFDLDNANPININKFKSKLNNVRSGFQTDIIRALDVLKEQIAKTNDLPKIVFILSDFADNINSDYVNLFLNSLNSIDIDIAFVNFALGGNVSDTLSTHLFRELENIENLSIFSSKNTGDILSYLSDRTRKINESGCCEMTFDIDPCYYGKDTTISAKLYFDYKDSTYIFEHNIDFVCTRGEVNQDKKDDIKFRNGQGEISIEYNAISSNGIEIQISDIMGNIVFENNFISKIGYNNFSISTSNFMNGAYIINIKKDDYFQTFKFMKY